jgi:predicted RNA-binding protein with PUA-like domain
VSQAQINHQCAKTQSFLGALVPEWLNSCMNYWLVKSEPEAYSWAQLLQDGRTAWTGVRNFTARNNLRKMKTGDLVFFYHSGDGKSVVGLARVKKEFYPDPTAKEGDWACVDLAHEKSLAKPVTLAQIKADKILNEMVMAKQSRLSVSPVTKMQFEKLLNLGETRH